MMLNVVIFFFLQQRVICKKLRNLKGCTL